MSVALFAGIPVSDFAAALPWYERLLGSPAFFPHDTEAVWELAENRYLFIVARPERAGGGIPTVMLDDLDGRVAEIAERGLEPERHEDYGNGARKAIYRDPDGNEIGFGGVS
jgi:catechol 2,3-dioxygenase-like lactoylglutathione lyase family enzyme